MPRGYLCRSVIAGASLWFAAAAIGFVPDDPLSESELRGQTIYRTGESPSGQSIVATSSGVTEVPAKNLPCAGCHGRDGRGQPEAGVFPPNVSWGELTRPYKSATPGGRRRTAYDESLAIRAITTGIDASGNQLDAAMPRFVMSPEDAADLIAYLKKIAAESDPGISDSSVRIGVLLAQGQLATIADALKAYFQDWNARGGAFSRRVELVFRELPPDQDKPGAYSDFFTRENVFALLNSLVAGAEPEIGALLEQEQLPLVGALTLLPQASSRFIFALDSGLPGQVDALAEYALGSRAPDAPLPVAITSEGVLPQASWDELRTKLAGSPWSELERLPAPKNALEAGELINGLVAKAPPAAFLFMPDDELRLLIEAARQSSWNAELLIPGAFAPPDVSELKRTAGRVILAMPFLPSDVAPDARADWSRLANRYRLEADHIATGQWSALCNARILAEGLKRAGRDLTRDKFIEALNGFRDFSCGYKQPIGFAPARRIGIDRVHILSLDSKTGGLIEAGSTGSAHAPARN